MVTCFTTITTFARRGNVTHNTPQDDTNSNGAPLDKIDIYTGEDQVTNPDNHVGTSPLLLTNRKVNNQQ
jgi:hypothetical protein